MAGVNVNVVRTFRIPNIGAFNEGDAVLLASKTTVIGSISMAFYYSSAWSSDSGELLVRLDGNDCVVTYNGNMSESAAAKFQAKATYIRNPFAGGGN